MTTYIFSEALYIYKDKKDSQADGGKVSKEYLLMLNGKRNFHQKNSHIS